MIIYLIGFMGSGKSSNGEELAKQLNLKFTDLDRQLEERMGMTVPEMFAQKGEAWFREQEHQLLRQISETDDQVIACGGGTPCFYDNMEFMNSHGVTVYLKMSVKGLQSRLESQTNSRPLLQGKTGQHLEKLIHDLLEKREDWYLRASYKVKALDLDIKALADTISEKLPLPSQIPQ